MLKDKFVRGHDFLFLNILTELHFSIKTKKHMF